MGKHAWVIFALLIVLAIMFVVLTESRISRLEAQTGNTSPSTVNNHIYIKADIHQVEQKQQNIHQLSLKNETTNN